MAMGMSYQEYWHGDPGLTKYYRAACKKRHEEQNHFAWLQGLYVCAAVGTVVDSALSKKGSSKVKYPDKPLDIFKQPQKAEAPKDNSNEVFGFLEKMMEMSKKDNK